MAEPTNVVTSDAPPEPSENLTLDDATLESLDVPELESEVPLSDDGGEAGDSTEPAGGTFAAPEESREQQLSRELADQRALSQRLTETLASRSQQPQPAPGQPVQPWSHLPADQQATWEQGAPILQAMIGQAIAPLVPFLQRANEANEFRALKAERHPATGDVLYNDVDDYADMVSEMRHQHYQLTGQWQPLKLAYFVAKGAGLLRRAPAPVQAAAKRSTVKRGQAARTAGASAVSPQQGQPSGGGSGLTEKRIMAMSDEEILNLGVRAGVPRKRWRERGAA
jgi:hypothetical protein